MDATAKPRTRHLPTDAFSAGVIGVFLVYTLMFYVYSIMVYHGMPAYLRGFMVFAAAFCLPFLIIPYIKLLLHPASWHLMDAVMWVMLVYFLIWMLGVEAFATHPGEFSTYLGMIVSWAMLFMLGRLVPVYGARMLTYTLAIFAVMFVLTVLNLEDGAFVPAQAPEEFATYQAYAMVLMVVTFTIIYRTKRDDIFWLVAVTAIVSVAMLGSRSELVGMLVLALVVGNLRRPSIGLIALQLVAGMLLFAAFLFLTGSGWNRLVNLTDEGAESTLNSRSDANWGAIETILKDPLRGGFGSYDEGLYAHNIMSIWVDFGMFGFGLYVLLLVMSLFVLLRNGISSITQRRNIVAIGLWIFMVLLLLTTKSGHYFLAPFVLGIIASHHSTREQVMPSLSQVDPTSGTSVRD